MKLKFNVEGRFQPDPFIFEDGDKLYLYVTGIKGVDVYSADDLFGVWQYEGVALKFDGYYEYWAPSVIKYQGKYYMYFSSMSEAEPKMFEFMQVASSDTPIGPFTNPKLLYNRFTIDSHVVETEKGLFLWYAENRTGVERDGTRVFVDKLIDPYTPANICKEVIVPTFNEEWYTPSCREDYKWHTIEGAFWFTEGDWQYVMYSGGCFQDDTYHVGYAAAKSSEQDLTKVDFIKNTNGDRFAPILIKNDFEEGTGHNSVIKYKGEYYAIYHARDYADRSEYTEARTARICKLNVADGKITAQMYSDKV